MDPTDWAKIQKLWTFLREKLDVERVLPLLYQEGILDETDQERINSERIRVDKVEKLLKILKIRAAGAYKVLCQSLEKEQPFIFEKLQKIKPEKNDLDTQERNTRLTKVLTDNFYESKFSTVALHQVKGIIQETLRLEVEVQDLRHAISETFADVEFCKSDSDCWFQNLCQKETEGEGEQSASIKSLQADQQSDCKPRSGSSTAAVSTIGDMSVDEIIALIKPCLHKKRIDFNILETFKREQISGDVFLTLTMLDIRILLPDLTFGQQKGLLNFRDEIQRQQSTNLNHTEVEQIESSNMTEASSKSIRLFDTAVKATDKYREGTVLEPDVTRCHNMIEPLHRFVNLKVKSKMHCLKWIEEETVKFSAACMNDRSNGTIHFGVESVKESAGSNKGKVVGIFVEKAEAREAISHAIRTSFFEEQHEDVLRCIREAHFVEVTDGCFDSRIRYVIEVDVVPHSKLTREDAFFIDVSTYGGGSPELYRFKGNIPMLQDQKEVVRFMDYKSRLKLLRQEKETRQLYSTKPDLRFKFVNLLTREGGSLTGDMYPILFLGPRSGQMDMAYIRENLNLIGIMEANAVFDFDPISDVKGMFQYIRNEQEQVVKALTTDNFDRNVGKMDASGRDAGLLDELKVSMYKPWIFCNGYSAMKKDPFSLYSWKQSRGEGFKEAIRFYHEMIPNGRAIVIFFLFSKDYSIMLEAAEETLPKFQNQWMVVAENEDIASHWKEELLRRHSVDKRLLQERCVIGLPWKQVNETIKQLVGAFPTDTCELPLSTGAFCPLRKKVRNELCDLEILSRCECENSDILADPNSMEHHRKDVEETFFRGKPVQWWNFWFKDDHVLRREIHEELLKKTKAMLNGEMDEDDKVGVLKLYHQPGAGGSTSARHVLWELRSQYRCCVVKQISENTCEHIFLLRSYEEPNEPNPILVLIDNQDEDKVNHLFAQLEARARALSRRVEKPFKVFCVLLICVRKTNIQKKHEKEGQYFMLNHDLSKCEIAWFRHKSESLEKSHQLGTGVDPRLLLSFNIMKENFNTAYTERTVKLFYQDIMKENEKCLLCFLALMNAYDMDFQPIPISAFDTLMNEETLMCFGLVSTLYTQTNWETRMSPQLKVLLNRTSKAGLGSQIKALCIINQVLAKAILQHIRQTTKRSVSELMMDLFKSDIFKYRSMSRDYFIKVVKDVLKKRSVLESGGSEKFSDLISHILEEESPDKAAEVLIACFEMTEDPMIAQQLARLYIHCQNWTEATKYAKIATSLKRENSYLWDTYGQIYKSQVRDSYLNCLRTGKRLGQEKANEVISCAFEALEKFRQEQQCSEKEKASPQNTNGYFGEIRVVLMMLELFSRFAFFPGKEQFHRFLVEKDFVPGELQFLEQDLRQQFKELQEGVETAMRVVEEKTSQVKEENIDLYSRKEAYLCNDNVAQLRENLEVFFGEDTDNPPCHMNPERSNEFRRRRICRLGGRSLTTLLRLRHDQDREKKLRAITRLAETNLKEPLYVKPFDYMVLLGTAVVASALKIKISTEICYEVLLAWSEKLFDMSTPVDRPYLETFMYLIQFHWPTQGRRKYKLCQIGKLKEAIKRWREAFLTNHPKTYEEKEAVYTRKKDTTFFFLGKGTGLQEIVYYEELPFGIGGRQIRGDGVWQTPEALKRLQRLTGTLLNGGTEVSISVESHAGNVSVINIPSSLPINQKSMWQLQVYFVLGFGWSGPKAYDITSEDPTVVHGKTMLETHQILQGGTAEQGAQGFTMHTGADGRSRSPIWRNKKRSAQLQSVEEFTQHLEEIESELQVLNKRINRRKPKRNTADKKKKDELQARKEELIRQRSELFGDNV